MVEKTNAQCKIRLQHESGCRRAWESMKVTNHHADKEFVTFLRYDCKKSTIDSISIEARFSILDSLEFRLSVLCLANDGMLFILFIYFQKIGSQSFFT